MAGESKLKTPRDTPRSTAGARKVGEKRNSKLTTTYLVLFNLLSTIGWSYILFITVSHVFALRPGPPAVTSASATVSTTLQRIFSYIPLTLRNATPLTQVKSKIYYTIPASVLPYFTRAKTLYAVLGPQVALVQSLAVLEVVHVLLGLVRSPISTTGMQVASRLYLVWGIAEQFPETRTNGLYASMVFAWSFTEVIRYTFYALNLVGFEPSFLLYIRYTTFYLLYPMGAGSEAFLMFSTLPPLDTFTKGWSAHEYARAGLFTIWWPGLYILYTHMIKQRGRVLGGKTVKTKAI